MFDFAWFCSKESFFCFSIPVDFITADSKFIAVGLAFGFLEDMKHFIVLIISKIAVSEDGSGILCILLGQKTLGKKGGVRWNVVVERLMNSFDELSFKGGVVLSLLLNHSQTEFKLNQI